MASKWLQKAGLGRAREGRRMEKKEARQGGVFLVNSAKEFECQYLNFLGNH